MSNVTKIDWTEREDMQADIDSLTYGLSDICVVKQNPLGIPGWITLYVDRLEYDVTELEAIAKFCRKHDVDFAIMRM